MQLSNFVKPLKCLPATCGPLLKVALWLGGLTNIFVGIIGGIWWPFVTIVALSLHIRLPVPLGMVPPIFDATGNAFVTSAASFIGVLTLWSAYFYMNPIWLVCAGLFFGKSFQYHRHKAAVKEKFRLLDLNHNLASNSEQIYPSMPFFVRLHPYFLRMYKDTNLGGGVRIRRIDPSSGTTTSSIDLWYQEDPEKSGQSILLEETTSSDLNTRDEKTSSKKPLFFFIHGGGWKGGGSRRHTQPVLLHRLVLNGWVVVACNYRKKKWPQHIDDCYNSLQYLMKEANSFDIDTSRIVVSGASAGGQLAALLHARIEADAASNIAVGSRSTRSSGSSTKRGADRKITPHRVVAMVLFYPALDPADDANFTATFPFDVPFMKAKSKQSLMHWFFERVILDDDISQWYSASPLRMLADNRALAKSWPPTMIVHGDLDAIVPVEHSFHFLSSLVRSDVNIDSGGGGLAAVSAKGTAPAGRDIPRHSHSISPSNGISEILSAGKDDNTKIESSDVFTGQDTGKEIMKTPITLDTPLLTRTGWQVRPQDLIITIPGAKHSFEAVGGETLDIVCAGVISWLTRLDSN